MLPDKKNPKWRDLVLGENDLGLSGLATKMLVMRVRNHARMDRNEAKINEAIDIAFDYFSKNADTAKTDIEKIFK